MNTKHVTSLETSKQLAEARIVIKSEFWWHFKIDELGNRCYGKLVHFPSNTSANDYPAPIATEILEWFPRGYDFGFELIKLGEGYGAICKDYRVMPYERIGFTKDDNAPDALALLLIRLTKDGLI